MTKQFHNITSEKRFRWVVLPLIILVILFTLGRQWLFKERNIEKDSMRRIRERGFLVAVTDRNSLDYFIYRGEPMGYQLDLLRSFSKHLGVPLKIIVSNDVSRLYYYLDLHVADIIAMNLPVSHEGKKKVRFPPPFGETRLVLVQRKPAAIKGKGKITFITSVSDFFNDTVYLQRNPFVVPLLKNLVRKAGPNLILVEEGEKNSEELIRLVAEGKIKYAICEENLVMLLKRNYPNIDGSFALSNFTDYSWGIDLLSDTLLQEITVWINKSKKEKILKNIYLSYYDNPKMARYFQKEMLSKGGIRLSPFDKEIRALSSMIRWDWRLLASLVYEESNFLTGLTSTRQAYGLMQLMPETARKFGMDSTSSPAIQLSAGVKFLKWLDEQLPEEIADPKERINFILAAYNVGHGRVLAARVKASSYGKDPNKWNNNVDYYLTWRSRKEPVSKADTGIDLSPYGTAGGFVSNILERYQHYRNNIPQ